MAGSIAGSLMQGEAGPSATPIPLQILVVAGGGGGGFWAPTSQCTTGGGGAGGLISTTGIVQTGITYNVQVGAGGSVNCSSVGSGQNSCFSTLVTSTGGGNGGSGAANACAGSPGGSGGAKGFLPSPANNTFWGCGISGQGHPAGCGSCPFTPCSGGGAGGGGAGSCGTQGCQGPFLSNMGCGGSGATGFNGIAYAGGGGPGGIIFLTGNGLQAGVGAIGGGSGAGDGSCIKYVYNNPGHRSCPIFRYRVAGIAGTTNSGGGGGGSFTWGQAANLPPTPAATGVFFCGNPTIAGTGVNAQAGGAGGSGIVIIAYPTSFPAATSTTGSPISTTIGISRYYCFTGSGSITW